MKIRSRLPTRLLCAASALWYSLPRSGRASAPPLPRRILVAHNLLLGDTIMVTPLLKKLRERFSQAEIVMTCKPAFTALYESRPYGVRVLPFDPHDVGTFFELFRLRGFDLAFLPTDNRFSWLARALDSRRIVAFEGDHPAYKNWMIDEFRPFPEKAMALGDLVAACLLDGPQPEAYEPAEWLPPAAQAFPLPVSPYCVLHVGASTPLKFWEPEKWRRVIAFAESRGLVPVLTAGPGEQHLISGIDPQRRHASHPGDLSLVQMWHLVRGARAVVCPDTGIGHLARLAGTPAVILFGPGSALLSGGGEFWRNMPDRKVTIPRFPCRDENVLFRRYLPWAEQCGRTTTQCQSPKCMQSIPADMAIDALDALLAQSPGCH